MALNEKQKGLLEKLKKQASGFKEYQQNTVLSALNELEKQEKATMDTATTKASKIGTLIKRLREQKEMSMNDLAAQLPITASTLGAIESGDIKTPSKPVIDAMAKALGVSSSRLTGQLPEGAEPADRVATNKAASIIVFTDKEGRDRWVSVSSTAFKDRDSEIVSSRSLKQAVAIGDATGKRGPLRFWHLPGVDLGDCDFQMLQGNMLIESGTFRKKEYAQAVAKIAPSLGVSLGFKHPITEPENGIFNNIFIYERSILPAHKAANPFTSITLKDSDMTTKAEKEQFFMQMVGEDLAGEFLQKTAQKNQDLINAGIAHKEFKDMTPDELRAFANDVKLLADEKEAEAQTAEPVGEFVTQKEFNQGLQMILTAIKGLNTASNATKETQAAIDGNLAKLKANQEQLQAELDGILGNASKSASHRPTRDNDAGIDVNALLSQAGVNSTKEWGIFSDAMQDLTGGA